MIERHNAGRPLVALLGFHLHGRAGLQVLQIDPHLAAALLARRRAQQRQPGGQAVVVAREDIPGELRLVAIEGLGPTPKAWAERSTRSIATRLDEWIREQRGLAGRLPRRYASIEDAFRRMQEENPHLTAEQARHLTVHGVNQNEDGTYSWKFDNYVRVFPPYDMRGQDIKALWGRISCPTLLLYGKESRSGDPAEDGRAAAFRHATVVGIDRAGHWLHHDQLDEFLRIVRDFLR